MRVRTARVVCWAGLASALAASGAVAASWVLGSLLLAPAQRSVGSPPPSLNASDIAFESASGSRLGGWAIQGREGGGVVVLAHSVRSNRREMLGRAELLHTAGYSVLLFDQQAHGESSGSQITFGHQESHDARAAVAYARSRWPAERMAYLGVSQGGAAALLGARPLDVDALILEEVYPTIAEAITNRVAIRLGPLAPLVTPLFLVQSRMRLGVSADEIAPIRGLDSICAPLLLIAGANDRHTTLAESERMFAAAPQPKELWVIAEAAHQDFHKLETTRYEARVLEFLARWLRGERT